MKDQQNEGAPIKVKDMAPETVMVKVEPNIEMLLPEENDCMSENFEFVKVKSEPTTEEKSSSVASHIEKAFQSLMSKVRDKLEGKAIGSSSSISGSNVKTIPSVEEAQRQLAGRVPRAYGNSGLKPFKCEECAKRFYDEISLTQHARVHKVEKPYSCKTCNQRFALRGNLIHHEATHRNSFPLYGCPFCGKDMKRKMFLNFHVKLHLSKQHGHHPCEICSCVFSTKGNLRRHMLAHKPFRCESCGNRFFTLDELRAHPEIHKEGRLKCEKCTLTFCTRRQLIAHRVHHGNVKQFTCEICGRRISNRGSFVVHLKIHRKERQLK